MTYNASLAWQYNWRTPWKRWNNPMHPRELSLAQCTCLDRWIYQGMHDMSTNEEPNLSKMTTHISYFSPYQPETICTSGHGFNHWTSHQLRIWCNSHNSQPWMFKSSTLFSLPYNNYWSTNCSEIPATPVPLVWTTREDHFWSWPPVHFIL